jgi:hypothetical protein
MRTATRCIQSSGPVTMHLQVQSVCNVYKGVFCSGLDTGQRKSLSLMHYPQKSLDVVLTAGRFSEHWEQVRKRCYYQTAPFQQRRCREARGIAPPYPSSTPVSVPPQAPAARSSTRPPPHLSQPPSNSPRLSEPPLPQPHASPDSTPQAPSKKKLTRAPCDDVRGSAKLRRKLAAEEAHDDDAVEADKTAAAVLVRGSLPARRFRNWQS